MLTVEEIKKCIDNDAASKKKRLAKIGVRYYEGDHDIKKARIFYINAEKKLMEDTVRNNAKIAHPFFTEIADQGAQYVLCDGEEFVKSDDPELQKILDERFNYNDHFRAELLACILGSQVKGFEYMYAYKNEKGKTVFECADSMGVVEVRAQDTEDKAEYLIYWYIDHIDHGEKQVKKIQVWDKAQTYYFAQVGDGAILPDETVPRNPRPHMIYQMDGDESTYYDAYGFIPFMKLQNGKKETSALNPIKSIIDDYDIMNCGLTNNIEDTNEALYVVTGFQGDDLEELLYNIKMKKHIGLADGGTVEIKTVDIPVEARKQKMELDEKNIYRFGFGLNTFGLKDTTATTNLAVKMTYSLLDLRANKIIIGLKDFLRQPVGIVLDEVNAERKTAFTQEDVYFEFKREIIINEKENADIELVKYQARQAAINGILDSAPYLPEETVRQLICEVHEIDYNEIKNKLPTDETEATAALLKQVMPEDAVNVGDNVV